MFHLFRLLIYH